MWHRMKCGNKTPTFIDKTCCSSWCSQLASLFSQTSSWRDHCFKMWGCRENEKARMPFSIILTNTTDSSYLGRIKVKQCLTLNFPAIKLTPSSEVGVFDFLATFLVSIVIGPLIPPFKKHLLALWLKKAQFSTDCETHEFINSFSVPSPESC